MKLFKVRAEYDCGGGVSIKTSSLIVADSWEETASKAEKWLSTFQDIRVRNSTITSIELEAPTKNMDFVL